MADPWNYAGPVTQLGSGAGSVTLVDESTFAISGGTGDISSGAAQGLFFRDTRILSQFEVVLNGVRAEPLAAVTDDPFSATFVARDIPAPGRADSTLMVFRHRHVGQGMREELVLRNFGDEATVCTVEVLVDADFADLFAVKEGRVGTDPRQGSVTAEVEECTSPRGAGSADGWVALSYTYAREPVARGVGPSAPTGWRPA